LPIEKTLQKYTLSFIVHFIWQLLIGIVDFVRFEIFGSAIQLQNLQKTQNLPGDNFNFHGFRYFLHKK